MPSIGSQSKNVNSKFIFKKKLFYFIFHLKKNIYFIFHFKKIILFYFSLKKKLTPHSLPI